MLKTKCLAILAMAAFLSADVVAQDKAMRTGFVRGSQIVGMEIQNNDHQKIGTVEDIVIDQDNGSIAFAVVALDPAMVTGEKLLALPWNSAKVATDSKTVVVDLTKDRLEKAPKFDKNAWPDMTAQWSNEVTAFYGVARPVGTPRDVAQPVLREDHDGMNRDGLNRTDNVRREVTTLTGKVKSFDRRDPALLMVTTDRGEVQAELGPVTFLDQQNLAFDPNADVTLRGYETTRDGRRIFIVSEAMAKDGRSVRLRGDDFAPLWAQNRTATTIERQPVAGYNGANQNGATNIELRDVTGTVTYVDASSGCGESAQGRSVTIRTDSGERVIALGPGSYLERQHWTLRPQDSVTVRGFETTRDGRRMFIATEVRRGNETWRLRREDGSPLW
jgi:sporulation protein YlmC with PRC-barrel domain